MDADRKPVDLVRVPREEQYFEREAVLGRDIGSVFPTEAKKAAAAEMGALAEALGGGNKKFISETELEEIKSKRGLSVEDGTIAAEKPLAQILKEAKEAKEAAFQDQWKKMKQGKNRPLDEDELDFLDTVAQREAEALRRARQEEEDALAAFHAAQQQQQGGPVAQMGPQLPGGGEETGLDALQDARVSGGGEQQPGVGAAPALPRPDAKPKPKKPLVAIRPIMRPVVKVVKGKEEEGNGTAGTAGTTGAATVAASSAEPASKRQRRGEDAEEQEQQPDNDGGGGSDGPGLAGLLGGYGSDASDS